MFSFTHQGLSLRAVLWRSSLFLVVRRLLHSQRALRCAQGRQLVRKDSTRLLCAGRHKVALKLSLYLAAMNTLYTYLPQDRRLALMNSQALPVRACGSVLLADISGFVPLTEELTTLLGAR